MITSVASIKATTLLLPVLRIATTPRIMYSTTRPIFSSSHSVSMRLKPASTIKVIPEANSKVSTMCGNTRSNLPNGFLRMWTRKNRNSNSTKLMMAIRMWVCFRPIYMALNLPEVAPKCNTKSIFLQSHSQKSNPVPQRSWSDPDNCCF